MMMSAMKLLACLCLFFTSTSRGVIADRTRGGRVRGTKPRLSRAWVTLLTGSSYNNTQLVATQIESIGRFSEYNHVTLVLPGVDKETKDFLSAFPTKIQEVSPIKPPYQVEKSWWNDVFSKLHIFGMTDYDQVAFLDYDAFLQKDGADGLFDACYSDFCGVEDNLKLEAGTPNERKMMNAGVMVARPSRSRFDFLVKEALQASSSRYEYPEQGFLTEVFLDKRFGDKGGDFNWINSKYNSCSRGYFRPSFCLRARGLEAQKKCATPVLKASTIFHHCGPNKLHGDSLCVWDKDQASKKSIRGGAEVQEEYSNCDRQEVQVFQELLVRVNPCALGGRGETECNKLEACQWCDSEIRCISSTMTKECKAGASRETQVNVERRILETSYMFDWSIGSPYSLAAYYKNPYYTMGGNPYVMGGFAGNPYANPYAMTGGQGNPYTMAGASGNPYAITHGGGNPFVAGGFVGNPYANPYTMTSVQGNPYTMAGASGNPYTITGGNPYIMAGASGNPYTMIGHFGNPYTMASSSGSPYAHYFSFYLLLQTGTSCEYDNQCETGYCASQSREEGKVCDFPSSDGSPCDRDEACNSGYCAEENGTCLSCDFDQVDGSFCTADCQCKSGECLNDVCA